jgi:hypothetical protein
MHEYTERTIILGHTGLRGPVNAPNNRAPTRRYGANLGQALYPFV